MATYTLTTTAAQETQLTAVSAHEGYPSNQAWIVAVLTEALRSRFTSRDEALISRARSGFTLSSSEQARIKTVLGLP